MYDFSVLMKTGSNPADINQFQSHTGKYFCAVLLSIITLKFSEIMQDEKPWTSQ